MGIEYSQLFAWLISLINFAIMFSLFRLVVIVPMEEAVRLREQRVRLRLKEIEEIAAEAKAKQEAFEIKFGDVETLLGEIQVASERSLAQAQVKIESKAEAEERYVLDKAKVEAEAIHRELETEIRSRIASQAVARAEAILGAALDQSAQNAIVSAGVRKVGGLNVA